MKLEWLEVLEFRHVTPGARMEFADGVNVIMGRNGTGKTNLLKLLGALTRWDVSALEKERFHVKFGAKAGELRLEVELKNVPPRPRFRAGMMEGMVEEMDEDWLVNVRTRAPLAEDVVQNYSAHETRVDWGRSTDGPRSAVRGVGESLDAAFWELNSPDRLYKQRTERFEEYWWTSLESLRARSGRGRMDEGLEAFLRLTEGGAGDGTSPHGFAITRSEDSRGNQSTGSSSYASILDKVVQNMSREEYYYEADLAEVLSELADVAPTLGLAKLGFLIRRTERKVEGEFITDTMKGITFKATLPNGSEFEHDQLSFGQKRMLTFLWYAAANEHGPIIVDELANGLHHAWIQKCFEVIGDRQAFLSTQNPLILDFLDFTSAEHTARSMVRCEVGERGWRWGNLNTEEAERLYRACQANFMHVSEILRSEGLW